VPLLNKNGAFAALVPIRPPDVPYQWKTPLLWTVLVTGAALLGWMAFRLSRDL
jgi:hypothetical protein